MKSREGYVYFDERSKKWVARFSPFVDTTKRKNFTRTRETRKDALKALRELIQQYESKGAAALEVENLSFEQLADRYREAKIIAAERAQSSAQSYWRALRDYFGNRRIKTIKYDDLETLKLHLIRKQRSTGSHAASRTRIGICSSFVPCSITRSPTVG